jgi:hypothetical protein
MLKGLSRFSYFPDINVMETQRLIADKAIEKGAYPV